tara:strand:- start:1106 stop:1249 length:144 start_codon:yes stop_codon:yes gene_type:complete
MKIMRIARTLLDATRVATVLAAFFVIAVLCFAIAIYSITAVGDFING